MRRFALFELVLNHLTIIIGDSTKLSANTSQFNIFRGAPFFQRTRRHLLVATLLLLLIEGPDDPVEFICFEIVVV
jgi:hypothetical protein